MPYDFAFFIFRHDLDCGPGDTSDLRGNGITRLPVMFSDPAGDAIQAPKFPMTWSRSLRIAQGR
jgi:hypothetical protein